MYAQMLLQFLVVGVPPLMLLVLLALANMRLEGRFWRVGAGVAAMLYCGALWITCFMLDK